MALIRCPECGNTVSDMATSCPHCGYPFTTKTAVSHFGLHREARGLLSDVVYGVFLDHQFLGELKNGGSLSTTLPCGTHHLRITGNNNIIENLSEGLYETLSQGAQRSSMIDKHNYSETVYEGDFYLSNQGLDLSFAAAKKVEMKQTIFPNATNSNTINTPKTQPKKRKSKAAIIFGTFMVLGALGVLMNSDNDNSNTNAKVLYSPKPSTTIIETPAPEATLGSASALSSTSVKKESPETNTPSDVTTEDIPEDWLSKYESDGNEILILPADVLYEYGSYCVGQTVVTSIQVKEKASNALKTTTENNTTVAYSIVADFSDKSEISSVKKGDTVVVIGIVDEMNSINLLGTGKTVKMNDCHLVTTGITDAEIEEKHDEAVKIAEAAKAAEEKKAADTAAAEKQDYKDSCEKVTYSDVARNPSQYKGKTIQVTGTVKQVIEGWFDSVTLLVDERGSNTWYATYTRSSDDEPRILENDKITMYGECNGVETYTTVLGNPVTIPAIKIKYYE